MRRSSRNGPRAGVHGENVGQLVGQDQVEPAPAGGQLGIGRRFGQVDSDQVEGEKSGEAVGLVGAVVEDDAHPAREAAAPESGQFFVERFRRAASAASASAERCGGENDREAAALDLAPMQAGRVFGGS